jgi:hypothetical protein
MLKNDIKEQIVAQMTPSSAKYKETLKMLIIQGMIRLLEDEVEIKVREGEQSLVRSIINDCEREYS